MGQKGDYVMLEVKNLTFQVQENGVERSIVENISFDVATARCLSLPDQMVEESPHLRKF